MCKLDKSVAAYDSYVIFLCIFFIHQTDDFGVFNTTLSNELIIASKTFHLTRKDLIRLNDTAIACSFATPAEKVVLIEKMNEYRKQSGIN